MKFSVLLPTLDRLEYLRYAIETVRRQDYADWEIIVSDNASDEDIAGHVEALGDARVRYVRTDRRVPVTENWNYALQHSVGDYIVMLGDDDGLLPGYFSSLVKALHEHPDPDYVYVGAYFFAYRGATEADPDGFLRQDHNRHFRGAEAHWLDERIARKIAKGYLDFRMPVASNMQFSLISRRMVDRLAGGGPFFRSPFPDFYATPLLFLRAQRILICPTPMVVIGITRKSYGAFHFTGRPAEGVHFLGNAQQLEAESSCRKLMLPGTSYYDSWLLAMEALHQTVGAEASPNYRRYRFLQIVHGYKARYFDRKIADKNLQPLRDLMTPVELLMYGTTLPIAFRVLRLAPREARSRLVAGLRRLIGQHAIQKEPVARPSYETLLEVFEAFDSRRHAA